MRKVLFSYLVDIDDEALDADETEEARAAIGSGAAELYDVKDAPWAEETTS